MEGEGVADGVLAEAKAAGKCGASTDKGQALDKTSGLPYTPWYNQ